MTTFANPGITAQVEQEREGEDEVKGVANPTPPAGLSNVEEKASTDGRQTEEAAQLTSGGTSGDASGPDAATEGVVDVQVEQAASASGAAALATASAGAGAEKVQDSATLGNGAKQDLAVSASSVEEPAPAAAATPRPAGKTRKPGKRLSLVARQSAKGAELRRKSGRASVGGSGGGRDGGNDTGTANVGAKPVSRAKPKPKPASPGAGSADVIAPKRLSLVARQAAAGAGRRSASRRGSDGGAGSAGAETGSAAAAAAAAAARLPSAARSSSARSAGEKAPRRTSLVARQAAAATERRGKLPSRNAPERERPREATKTSSGSAGDRAKTTAGKRRSLVARQSASAGSGTAKVATKSSGAAGLVGDCPEVSLPVPESAQTKEDSGVLSPPE